MLFQIRPLKMKDTKVKIRGTLENIGSQTIEAVSVIILYKIAIPINH